MDHPGLLDEPKPLPMDELQAGLARIREAPSDHGVVRLIVRRPTVNSREVLEEGHLDAAEGLAGDNWKTRGCPLTPDKSADPERQLNIMGARVIELLAQVPERWQLAGDQLFLDLDLSVANLPAGTRLALGTAVIEVTPPPHLGCDKFVRRFGVDAMKFVNSPVGRELRLRGLNARVVQPGTVRLGDRVTKVNGR